MLRDQFAQSSVYERSFLIDPGKFAGFADQILIQIERSPHILEYIKRMHRSA